MIYFTSDLHFNHTNIINLCYRPFNDIETMNKTIIDNYNKIVTNKDTVYILGDCGFKPEEQLKQLKGKKILIKGNHDKLKDIQNCFINIYDYLEIQYNHQKFCLFHYPIAEWNGYFNNSYCLHGHQHNKPEYNLNNKNKNFRCYDVGVDANNFTPVSIDEIITFFKYLTN